MAEESKTTISVNGGPEVPIDLDGPSFAALNAIDEAFERGTGHNSGGVAADQLRLFIERIERLEEEKKGLADDVRDVYAEAKSNGYDSKTMRRIVALRKMETHVRQEAAALMDTYASALGLQYSML